MKTVFSLFPTYQQAREAAKKLLDEGFEEKEMNAIVSAEIADDAIEEDKERLKTGKTSEIDEKTVYGLDALLGGEKAIDLAEVGEVYAGGELATSIVRTASAPGAVDDGLEAALVDFRIPHEQAKEFSRGVLEEGILFFVRCTDDRAPTAGRILHENEAELVYSL